MCGTGKPCPSRGFLSHFCCLAYFHCSFVWTPIYVQDTAPETLQSRCLMKRAWGDLWLVLNPGYVWTIQVVQSSGNLLRQMMRTQLRLQSQKEIAQICDEQKWLHFEEFVWKPCLLERHVLSTKWCVWLIHCAKHQELDSIWSRHLNRLMLSLQAVARLMLIESHPMTWSSLLNEICLITIWMTLNILAVWKCIRSLVVHSIDWRGRAWHIFHLPGT